MSSEKSKISEESGRQDSLPTLEGGKDYESYEEDFFATNSCSETLDRNVDGSTLDRSLSDSPTPDGGLWAWLQVLSGFMLYLNSWGLITSFGVFQTYYKSTLFPSQTNSAISWLGTIQGLLLSITSLFAGPLLDRGYPRALVLGGTFFVVFGLMMTSLCTAYWQLVLAQSICVGLGAGPLFIVAAGVLPSWFDRKRAFATGLAATGSSLGGVIYPIVFHRLAPKIGFGWTVRVMAFIALATCLVSLACARLRTLPPPRPKIVDFSGFKEPSFLLFAVVSLMGFMGLYVPFFYVTEYAIQHHDGAGELAQYFLPILSAGSIIGRIVPAFLADRLGPLNVLSFCTVSAGIIAFCWLVVKDSTAGLIVWALFYGAFSGAFVSLQTSTVASITRDMRFVGGRMGMNNFCGAIGVLVGNPIAGALHANTQWSGLQVFVGATLTASAVFALLTGIQKTGSLKGKA